MRFCVYIVVVLASYVGFGASANWTGVSRLGWSNSEHPSTTKTDVNGIIYGDDGFGASVNGMIFTRSDNEGIHIKSYDYSETAATVNTRWLLAIYGDVLGQETLSSFRHVELCDYVDCGIGGDKIDTPTNFYLAFVAEDWSDYVSGIEDPHVWYGWVNFSVNTYGALDVLASGINLDGGAVVIGGGAPIPEPSGGILALLGLGMLGLRRRCRIENAKWTIFRRGH